MSIAADEAGSPAKTEFQIRNNAAYEWMKGKVLTTTGTGHETSREPTQEEHAFGTCGFTAGAAWQSQREPTEAEIEAAAIAVYKYYFDSRGNPITLEIAKHDVQRFNGSTDEFSDPDVSYARNIATIVLRAARKAVTGDE